MNKALKTVSGMFVIMMAAKLLGQLREIMLAGYYGTGNDASAFLVASQIPLNFFDMVLGLAIVSAFVPVFNEYLQKKGKETADEFAGNFVGIVLIISVAMVLFGVIFSKSIVSLLATGFDETTTSLASKLLVIMFPSLLFTAVAYSYAGIVQSYGEFKIPAAMSIASNLTAILYFVFLNKFAGIFGLAAAMLIGWAMQLLILLPALFKFKYKFGLAFNFLHPGMKKVYRLALPILLSSWAQPLNVMINTYLASFIDGGNAVSYINYANKLYIIIVGVFTMSVTNLILPELSRLFADNNRKKSAEVIESALKSGIIFIIPVMMVFLAYSYQIVEVVYMRGAFDEKSVAMTSTALYFYSFGMLGYGLQEILNKSFYSMQNSVVPMKNAFLTIAVNVIFSFTLYKSFGVGGLAFAAAIAATVSAANLLRLLKKNLKEVAFSSLGKTFIKTILAGCVASVISKVIFSLCSGYFTGLVGKFLLLGACAGLLLVVYIIFLIVLRTEEIKNLIKRKV